MSADAQIYFNIAIMVFGGLGGWILNNLKDSMRTLQESDIALATKLQAIEVLVAGTYVTRVDLEKLNNALFTKLDRIDEKLDSKADRVMCDRQHGPVP